jgi:hypothetical protein
MPEATPNVAPIGRDIGRDIVSGEAEHHLDAFIAKRHEQRLATEGERQAEELYAASVRAFNAARDQERRAEWATFHRSQAERHRATLTDLIQHHQDQAAKYRENRP